MKLSALNNLERKEIERSFHCWRITWHRRGGSLEGMKYNTFNEWMNGKRKAEKPVKCHIMRVFDSFIRHDSWMDI